jgi:GDPmannose 4,6-dehydratase
MPTALITGINGQDGSYLAELLLEQGYRVVGLIRPGGTGRCSRIEAIRRDLEIIEASLLDESYLRKVIEQFRPREIYNLAARASSSQLFSEPVLTGDFNGLAVVRILEAIRITDTRIRFCQASSSELFGNALHFPQSESTPFRPRNPYGIAKLYAHGMVESYRKSSGLFACSAILFNHESPRRGPEFVTRKITLGVAHIAAGLADSVQLDSLEASRDWGYAGDYVRAMWQMLKAPVADDYVVATGESHTVREFCELAFARAGLDYRNFVKTNSLAGRPADSIRLLGDASKIKSVLGWRPTVSFEELVHSMVDADIENILSPHDDPRSISPAL